MSRSDDVGRIPKGARFADVPCRSFFVGKTTHEFIEGKCSNCGICGCEPIDKNPLIRFGATMLTRRGKIEEPLTFGGVIVGARFLEIPAAFFDVWYSAACERDADAMLEIAVLLGRDVFGLGEFA